MIKILETILLTIGVVVVAYVIGTALSEYTDPGKPQTLEIK